jgi:hypothetical protein
MSVVHRWEHRGEKSYVCVLGRESRRAEVVYVGCRVLVEDKKSKK